MVSGVPAHVQSGRMIFRPPGAGYLRLEGPDRVDFLQRQTSNDIRLLAPGRIVTTVLSSPAARILDVFQLIPEQEAIGILPLPGHTSSTLHYLKHRIFFMDKVTLTDASPEVYVVDLEGPLAGDLLRSLGLAALSGEEELTQGSIGGAEVRVLGQRGLDGLGYRLLSEASAAGTLEAAFRKAGAGFLTATQYDLLRIEAGLPAPDSELNEDYSPLELGLEVFVSTTKGCYTGQEVIARQINYDKITRKLVGLKLEAPAQAGVKVTVAGKVAGQVTSAVESPHFGPIALAVLKRPHFSAGTEVCVGEEAVVGVVARLPFNDS